MKTSTVLLGLGVVGLGVLGAVTLSKKAEAQPAIPPGPLPPAPLPPAPLPPSPLGKGGLVFVDGGLTSHLLHLKNGQYYRGRFLLRSSDLPPFNASASDEIIAKGLVAMGFVDVRIFPNVSNLPSDWPRETALNTQAGTRWFQGQWNDKTGDWTKPRRSDGTSPVESVWVTASPGLVAARAAQAVAVSGVGSVMSG